MALKIDPFTLTPGVAGKPYIDCGITDEFKYNKKVPITDTFLLRKSL